MSVVRAVTVIVVMSSAITGSALAQGFQLNEHGMCAVGRAGTGAAKPCADGSSIWFNPAGIAGTRGWTATLGSMIVAAGGSFTDDYTGQQHDLANPWIPVPHAYVTYGMSDRIALGVGAFVPYGLGTRWGVDFPGRFLGYDNDLRSVYVQPTVAVKLHEKIAVGAGLDLVLGSVRLTQRVDLAGQVLDPATGTTFGQLGIPAGTDFASAKLEGSATGFAGHFGVQVSPTEWLRIGARYLSRVNLRYSGTVDFEPVETGIVLPPQNPISIALGLPVTLPLPLDDILAASGSFLPGRPLADSTASTAIPMPDQIIVGVAVRVAPTVWVLGEWQWANWSIFETISVDFDNAATPDLTIEEGFQSTSAIRGGIEWQAADRWTLRGGYLYHGAASPAQTVTPLLPESSRHEGTVGLGLVLSERLSVDAAYQYIRQHRRRGRVVDAPLGTPPQQVVDQFNSGLYAFGGHIFGTTLTVRF